MESAKFRGLHGFVVNVGLLVHRFIGDLGQTVVWVAWGYKILT